MCSFFNVEGNTESHSGTVLGLFPTRRVRTTCGLTVRYCSQYDSTNSVSQTSFLTCKPDIMTLRAFSFLASFSRSISTRIREVASTTLFKDDSSAPVWFGCVAEADWLASWASMLSSLELKQVVSVLQLACSLCQVYSVRQHTV